ncbi:hypothetical protein ACH5RR_010279 [Cinchona calisaya]|uniref:LOB domain-containing protein n=1 Tax=Cinchona calisaya TaxID=153742 RepID=A0ABD3AIE0_9GENT
MSKERGRLDEIAKKLKTELDASSQIMGRRHMLGPPGTLNTITPCAACKLLRRRCAEECPFSPYFSPHEPQKFAAVHKVFGASNVSKMLMEVPEFQRADAANSLVYEANVRLRDPVYGCMGAISALQHQVQSLQAELHAIRNEILRYKYSEAAANSIIASSAHHAATLVSSSGAVLAVAEMQQANPATIPVGAPPPPPPTPPPPPPSILIVSTSSSSSSAPNSLYTPPSSSASFSTITNNNIPFFD